MNEYDHLPLPLHTGNIQRQTRGGGGGYKIPEGRNKSEFATQGTIKAERIIDSFSTLKEKFAGKIEPTLIYEIEVRSGVSPVQFEPLLTTMGIHVLSVAEGKKGYWIVFSDDENLNEFKRKLTTYGSERGPNYDFFNAIDNFQDIPAEKKIGKLLLERPLTETPEFIDIELWRMVDVSKNLSLIEQLKTTFSDRSTFRITDQLISKSFVLLRVKVTKAVFDQIIELKEISRADRPNLQQFNPFEYLNPNISAFEINSPPENATGILIIDSGIISNHPLLEKCVGNEANFQSGETATHDTVGHGTGVAGCAAYGDIEKCLTEKVFNPSNWIFSAKVMYAERDFNGNPVNAAYDPEKLIEHQFKDAVDSFVSDEANNIKVVNISLGNVNEIWHKDYNRQLPLATIIDELAITYPNVVFIVSAGNQHPESIYSTVAEIKDNYPKYLIEDDNFKIINPATSALALTVGSICGGVRIQNEHYGAENIKTPIADENQPSPFTRTGGGINGMVKPELVEYGGNIIMSEISGRIVEDKGGKIPVINNQTASNIFKLVTGTSFSSSKVAHLAGKIANKFPNRSANFIKNMMLVSASHPFEPKKLFYSSEDFNKEKSLKRHSFVSGYGLANYNKAINSFDKRVVLFDEGQIALNQIKVYSLQLPDLFFSEHGKKKITIALTFNPETRSTRGDSYLGNRMEFHLFHSINPQELINHYGVISESIEQTGVPLELQQYEIKISGGNNRKAGCHQKACKEYKREPENIPNTPISLVLINYNKWLTDIQALQDYCISVTFEHENANELYNRMRSNIQARARNR